MKFSGPRTRSIHLQQEVQPDHPSQNQKQIKTVSCSSKKIMKMLVLMMIMVGFISEVMARKYNQMNIFCKDKKILNLEILRLDLIELKRWDLILNQKNLKMEMVETTNRICRQDSGHQKLQRRK